MALPLPSSQLEPLWKPPQQLTVANLRLILSKHGVPYKSRDLKSVLVEHYTKLARRKVPQDVALWETPKQKAASKRLNMCEMRSLLTEHGVSHAHAKSRATLLEIYNVFRKHSTVQGPSDRPDCTAIDINGLNTQEQDSDALADEFIGKHPRSESSREQSPSPKHRLWRKQSPSTRLPKPHPRSTRSAISKCITLRRQRGRRAEAKASRQRQQSQPGQAPPSSQSRMPMGSSASPLVPSSSRAPHNTQNTTQPTGSIRRRVSPIFSKKRKCYGKIKGPVHQPSSNSRITSRRLRTRQPGRLEAENVRVAVVIPQSNMVLNTPLSGHISGENRQPASSPCQPASSPRKAASSPREPASSPSQPASSPRQPASSPRQVASFPAPSPCQPSLPSIGIISDLHQPQTLRPQPAVPSFLSPNPLSSTFIFGQSTSQLPPPSSLVPQKRPAPDCKGGNRKRLTSNANVDVTEPVSTHRKRRARGEEHDEFDFNFCPTYGPQLQTLMSSMLEQDLFGRTPAPASSLHQPAQSPFLSKNTSRHPLQLIHPSFPRPSQTPSRSSTPCSPSPDPLQLQQGLPSQSVAPPACPSTTPQRCSPSLRHSPSGLTETNPPVVPTVPTELESILSSGAPELIRPPSKLTAGPLEPHPSQSLTTSPLSPRPLGCSQSQMSPPPLIDLASPDALPHESELAQPSRTTKPITPAAIVQSHSPLSHRSPAASSMTPLVPGTDVSTLDSSQLIAILREHGYSCSTRSRHESLVTQYRQFLAKRSGILETVQAPPNTVKRKKKARSSDSYHNSTASSGEDGPDPSITNSRRKNAKRLRCGDNLSESEICIPPSKVAKKVMVRKPRRRIPRRIVASDSEDQNAPANNVGNFETAPMNASGSAEPTRISEAAESSPFARNLPRAAGLDAPLTQQSSLPQEEQSVCPPNPGPYNDERPIPCAGPSNHRILGEQSAGPPNTRLDDDRSICSFNRRITGEQTSRPPNPRLSTWRNDINQTSPCAPDQFPPDPICISGVSEKILQAVNKYGSQMASTNEEILEAVVIVSNHLNRINGANGSSLPQRASAQHPLGQQSSRLGTLPFWIRRHCRTLFGSCMDGDQLPEPATQTEKATWEMHTCDNDSSDDDSAGGNSSRQNDESINSDADADPSFPYGAAGPGHRQATPETLSIIWHGMRKVGIKTFRPNLGESFRSSENAFLWNLAFKLFIKLVRCGEYDGIDVEIDGESQVSHIYGVFKNHVQQVLMRKYREKNNWTQQRRDDRAQSMRQTTRLAKLKESRGKLLMSQCSFMELRNVLEECCSDDETIHDDETMHNQSEDEMSEGQLEAVMDIDEGNGAANKKGKAKNLKSAKRLAVNQLPWRHPRLDSIVRQIDWLASPEAATAPRKKDSVPRSIRERVENPKVSVRKAPKKLPGNCYNPEWLKNLTPHELKVLKPKRPIDLSTYLLMLEKL